MCDVIPSYEAGPTSYARLVPTYCTLAHAPPLTYAHMCTSCCTIAYLLRACCTSCAHGDSKSGPAALGSPRQSLPTHTARGTRKIKTFLTDATVARGCGAGLAG